MCELRSLVPVLMLSATLATAFASDLSSYRNFRFGAGLASTAAQAGTSPAQAKDVHRRPALIQEMEWRPHSLGATSKIESVQGVLFTFYDDALFRVVVKYDRTETEGMTTDDLVQAISADYGAAERLTAPVKQGPAEYGDQKEVVARWQDAEYRFELIRSAYGPTFSLIGVLKRLEEPARAAVIEAQRLEDQEAPAREAARLVGVQQEERAKLDKARVVNKEKFRP